MTNPFTVLGLPTRPDLTDEQVRAAWRAIAAASHPDRPGGGNPALYAAASAAYAALRTPGRGRRRTPTSSARPHELPRLRPAQARAPRSQAGPVGAVATRPHPPRPAAAPARPHRGCCSAGPGGGPVGCRRPAHRGSPGRAGPVAGLHDPRRPGTTPGAVTVIQARAVTAGMRRVVLYAPALGRGPKSGRPGRAQGAGQGCPAFAGQGMAARSPSPGQDTAQTTTRRSPSSHGYARPGNTQTPTT